MLNLKTTNFPLAELLVPPTKAKQAGLVVDVAKPLPAFNAVPANEVTSFPVVAVIHVLELFVPSK